MAPTTRARPAPAENVPPSFDLACRLCGAACDGPFVAREMMFGGGETFDYHRCRRCGLLQIAKYPENLGQYYSERYYSLDSPAVAPSRFPRLAGWLRRSRARHGLGRRDPVGALLARLRPPPECYTWFKHAGVTFDSAILDVGCGDGAFLRYLRGEGFRALEGVDPFAHERDRRQPGFVIRHALAELARTFDFVLLDDSLEHMPDQRAVLRQVRSVCAPSGWVCLGLPLVGEAWRIYQTDWVQLDPPRHLYLHTEASVALLAQETGFRVERVIYDSTPFQFWGSEQYRMNVPLLDERSHARRPGLFTPEQLGQWERRSRELNDQRSGDHATFLLRPATA
jgi:SAM-dependent methyltransferase